MNLIVGTFDQNCWLNCADQFYRRGLIEDNDKINGLQRRQYLGARRLVLDWAITPLQFRDGRIAIEANDQFIAGAARRDKQPNVTGMQKIEAPIGKANA